MWMCAWFRPCCHTGSYDMSFQAAQRMDYSICLSAGHFHREGITVCTSSTLPWLIVAKVGRVRGEHCARGGQLEHGDAR